MLHYPQHDQIHSFLLIHYCITTYKFTFAFGMISAIRTGRVSMKLAITKFKDAVGPRFETASSFAIFSLKNREVSGRETVNCSGCEGFGRVRILRDQKIDVLICGGIKSFYRDMLRSLGLAVIDDISDSIESALKRFRSGDLKPMEESICSQVTPEIPHEDLVCWAKELFISHGYRVEINQDDFAFPVDLIARVNCPVCGQTVEVAICCGAHIYRPEQEIREFHHALSSRFKAMVYVNFGNPKIRECCDNYGIELIDAGRESSNRDEPVGNGIPLLRNRISGHEAAFENE